jgi:FkbM family methyltransferase
VITHAQNFEDVMLARLFAAQGTGFYVDIGASHPDELSVTKYFYDLGWSGINVEPIRKHVELFQERRPRDINLNVAVGRETGARDFFEVEQDDALSTFDPQQASRLKAMGYTLRTYPVSVVSADSIFASHGLDRRCVDFAKIDVEGLEAEVLASLDLKRFRPRVLVIEAIQPAYTFVGWEHFDPPTTHEAWEPGVLAADYTFAHFDGISRFYVRNESSELVPRLGVPPGVFDGIVFAREQRPLADSELSAEKATRTNLAETAERGQGVRNLWTRIRERIKRRP